MLDRLFVVVALLLIGILAFCIACFPHVFPRLINSYYSLIGMKTRVAEEDYSKVTVRLAGAIILVAEIVWFFIRLNRTHV
jgi:hypothetical protein